LAEVGLVEHEGVLLARKLRLVRPILLQPVEVFQEQQPRGLLGVVQLGGAAGLLAKDIVDVLERLLEQGCPCLSFVAGPRRRGRRPVPSSGYAAGLRESGPACYHDANIVPLVRPQKAQTVSCSTLYPVRRLPAKLNGSPSCS